MIKCLEDFEKMTDFYKSFCPFFSKSLHIHFNPSQNVSPILLLNGLVMVLNEGSIVCKCFKKGNVFTLILRFSFKLKIFQISLAMKNFKLFFNSKFKFDRVHEKMFNDTH